MATPTLNDVLTDLFSNKIIVTRDRNNTLKTLDVSRKQAGGSLSSRAYGKGAYTTRRRRGGWGGGYSLAGGSEDVESMRRRNYSDFENMDQDSIVSAALDIYADECTVKDKTGHLITIDTSDERKKKLLYNLYYEVLNIENNLWQWVRETCKYGDYMLYLPLHPEYGILGAIPMHPTSIKRDDNSGENGDRTMFFYEGQDAIDIPKKEFEFHEIAHFRLLGDSSYLPYGKSILEGAKNTFKKLIMMEDAMLIHRIMRAPDRRMVLVDVGSIHPDEVDDYMEDLTNEMKKVPYKDDDGNYNLSFNLQNMLEDYYIPIRGGSDNSTTIENLPGLENSGQIEDIEYQKNKLLSYLKIPKAYMGEEQDTEGKSVLASQDMRFARTIERVQRSIISELHKLGLIHLKINGYPDEELLDFSIDMDVASIIYQRQQVDLLNEQVNLVSNMLETKMFSREYIYENVFKLSQNEWKHELDQIAEDLKLAFRYAQIEEEGNDPKVTGEVRGTPHALMLAQKASAAIGTEQPDPDEVKKVLHPDKRVDNEGQPKAKHKWETERDQDMGRDPSGRRGANPSSRTMSINPSNLKTDQIDRISKQRTQLFEDNGGEKMLEKYSKVISFLNEDNLLEDK